ncbi:hypothetical protein ACSBR1_011809 [Camellia fascicularis]
MVSSSPKASSKEMEGNALIGVDKLPEKIYKTLDESTKILRFKVPFPMFAYPIHLDSKGKEVDLSTYKGKVLLVVNVASKCGLADSNYTQLTEVYNKYKEKDSNLLSNLSKMRHLDLSYNNFDEDAFRILGTLPSLKFLSLVSNSMEGPLSNQATYGLDLMVMLMEPFMLDEFVQAFHDYDPRLLGEIHVALLRSIIKDIEDGARTPSSTGLGVNQNAAANPGGGHPQIVEGAYAWGFDIRSWQRHLNPLTWPEILRQFALSAGFGPKLKKRSIEKAYLRDELRTSFGINQQKHI